MFRTPITHRREGDDVAARRFHLVTLLASAFFLATAVPLFAHASARADSVCQASPSAIAKTNSVAERQATTLLNSNRYTQVTRTLTPKPSSTKGFTGYETIALKAPIGRTPVIGFFKLAGNTPCSVVVTSANVDLSRNAYVVKMKFPGEQGMTGSLKVTLVAS
jgi:hypothetical protein